jgi:Lon protease-like protein
LAVTVRLPLFPLGTVLFPGLVLPLHIFEPRYRALIRDLMDLPADQTREFGVIAIRGGWEVPATSPGGLTAGGSLTLYDVGCTAEIRQINEHPDGRFDIVTVGRRRFRLAELASDPSPYLVGEVDLLTEATGDEPSVERLATAVLELFQRYITLMRRDAPEVGEQLPDRPAVLSYLVAASAALSIDDKQRLLAAADTAKRLRAERSLLRRELALLSRLRAVPAPLGDLTAPGGPN